MDGSGREPTSGARKNNDMEVVLGELAVMMADILQEDGPEGLGIALDTRFFEDLEVESIDLVALAAALQERWGSEVNFAEFIAAMDLDTILGLTAGQLVTYIVSRTDVTAGH
ncbi:acyl carrier protein [Streptomyces sp. HUAS TT7]|uniref:acyl carrier protein n=1 Tax=Streptomyces sp. HUAS TT7 TaxID=3447507 RepID=UPI003F65F33A